VCGCQSRGILSGGQCQERMSTATSRTPCITIASNDANEAKLVRTLLEEDFERIEFLLTDEVRPVKAQAALPEILILVYKQLSAAEEAYLGLLRDAGGAADGLRHRTLVFCNRDEVDEAYHLCRRGLFDDYIAFWPTMPDTKRLLMSVFNAARSLAGFTPVAVADVARAAPPPEAERVDGPRPSVLIVDDDAAHRKLTARFLATTGYELRLAADGYEAMRLLTSTHVDLVLLDIRMPGLDGMEILRRLRRSSSTAALPVIMMTGAADRDVVRDTLEHGVVDFLVKPFDRGTLLAKVKRALAREKDATSVEA
jgi:CheY-like chemotaxis protein